MEDASADSGQKYLCAIRGTAAGGGYELALATDHIVLADDGNSTVALPELPLLAVLPGTGGLTRVTDKRKVRRDLADAFCTVEEGVKGAARGEMAARRPDHAQFQVRSQRRQGRRQEAWPPIRSPGPCQGHRADADRTYFHADAVAYSALKVEIDRSTRRAVVMLNGPGAQPPASAEAIVQQGATFWPLRLARELDDAILHLRLNEPEIGV